MLYACSQSDPAISPHQEIVESSDFLGIRVFQDEFDSLRIRLAGSHDLNFIVSFENMLFYGEYLVVSAIQDCLPVIFKDQFGNEWNIWEQVVKGPLSGTVLKPTTSVMGFFFAMAAFYPEASSYGDSEIQECKFTTNNDTEWLVEMNQVFAGTLSFDAIPAIGTPRHIESRNRDFLDGFFVDDNELGIGIWIDSIPRVYPHAILNWHEIVNDSTPDHFYSIT